ncbi:MAG: hypothetical protein WBA74_02850 [Cyclobacteriaceae bacterium]
MRVENQQIQQISNACEPVNMLVDHFRNYGLIVTDQQNASKETENIHIKMSASKITDDITSDHIAGISESTPGEYTCKCHAITIKIVETTPVCFW